VSHLQPFGSTAYAMTNQKKSKLDNKTVKCILLGMESDTEGYRLLLPNTNNHVLVSRDVTFAEPEKHKKKEKEDTKETTNNTEIMVEDTLEESTIQEDMEETIEEILPTIEDIGLEDTLPNRMQENNEDDNIEENYEETIPAIPDLDLNLSVLPPIEEVQELTFSNSETDRDSNDTSMETTSIVDSPAPTRVRHVPEPGPRTLDAPAPPLVTRTQFWGIHPANILAPPPTIENENRRPPNLRRSERLSKLSNTNTGAFSIEVTNPNTVNECKKREDWPLWEEAIKKELDSLKKLKTWELVDKPANANIVGNKFVFKIK
jgi:hypothetical protein